MAKSTESERPPRGCLFYGLISAALVFTGILIGVYFGTRKAVRRAVEDYTTNAPARIPTLRLSPAEEKKLANDLQKRWAEALHTTNAASEVVLGENELNLLVATSPDLSSLSKEIYLQPEGNQLRAYLSLALDHFEPWKKFARRFGANNWNGRYLNGTAIFEAGVTNGALKVYPKKIVVSAITLPDEFIARFPWETLTKKANQDPTVKPVLARIKKIEVRDNAVHVELAP
jgi:hypothetical protein